jgi:hypothetical protein
MKIQKLKLEMDGWMSLWAFVTDFAAMHPFFGFAELVFFCAFQTDCSLKD